MSKSASTIKDMGEFMTPRAIALYGIMAIALSWCIQIPVVLLLGFAVGAICWWSLRSPGGSREVP